MNQSVMVDPSALFDKETFYELRNKLEDITESLDILVPRHLIHFLKEVDSEEFTESAISKFYDGDNHPELDAILDFCYSNEVQAFEAVPNEELSFDRREVEEDLEEAISWYKRYDAWGYLHTTLLLEMEYLYSNSIIGAVNEKFHRIAERVGSVTINAGEKLGEKIREQVRKKADLAKNHPFVLLFGIFKYVILAIAVTQLGFPAAGSPVIEVAEALLETKLGDNILAIIDP